MDHSYATLYVTLLAYCDALEPRLLRVKNRNVFLTGSGSLLAAITSWAICLITSPTSGLISFIREFDLPLHRIGDIPSLLSPVVNHL